MFMRMKKPGARGPAAAAIATTLLSLGLAAASAADAPVSADAAGLVKQIKVLPDQAPDCSSLKTIVESVTRGCKTNDAKAIAIYNFMLLTHFHCNYAGEPGGLAALKEINVYGWGVCGGTHAVQSALWRELGWNWRFIGWPGHTTVEAQYDGRWHYFDAFLKCYAWVPDGKGGQTVASEADWENERDRIWQRNVVYDEARKAGYFKNDQPMLDGKPNWRARDLCSCDYWMLEKDAGGKYKGGVPKAKDRSNAGPAEGWMGYNHATGNYSTDVNLAPGFVLTNTWDAVPGCQNWGENRWVPTHSCGGYADTRNSPGLGLVLEPYNDPKVRPKRTYANGSLCFTADFSSDAVLRSFVEVENVKRAGKALVPAEAGKPAYVVLRLASPYVITKASGRAAGAASIELSVDAGKKFQPVSLANFTAALKNKYVADLRIGIQQSLSALAVDLVVQNNSSALPYLSPGKNKVAVSVADPQALAGNRLVVTYAYRLGSRRMSLDDVVAQGKRVAVQVGATWDEPVTCVQKIFTAKDLPATFDIDCPTPKGRYAVYPRMVFVRREVVAPGASPLGLPEGAVAAKVGPDDELPGLPSPFTVGIDPPPMVAK
jgi:hypothetical protein